MENPSSHSIFGPEQHGRRELPIEDSGIDPWDPNLAGGFENAEAIEDIVADGIHEANVTGTVIKVETARVIARALANAHNDDSPALDTFARTGEGDRNEIEQEYFDIHEDPQTPAVVRNWIDWLATYLFHRTFTDEEVRGGLPYRADDVPNMLVADMIDVLGEITTVHRPTAMTELGRLRMGTQLETHLSAEGDPLRAYLSLAYVDATEESLLDDFHSNYIGWYSNIDEVVEGLTEIQDWERELVQWSMERGLQGMVALDREEIEKVTRDTWDIVEMGDRLYVFSR